MLFFQVAQAKNVPLTLSLEEAILLAVRSNPNVQSSHLAEVVQKFNVYVQRWQFHPHYSLQATTAIGRPNQSFTPGVSLQTPFGTQVNVTSTVSNFTRYKPALSVQIMQPLLRGFGTAVVEAALCNAQDSELIARLNIEGVLRNTVTEVMSAYIDVLLAERLVLIDQDALKRAEISIHQTKIFIKAGHKAGSELITVKANAASARTQLINDKNILLQAKYTLLTAIGLDPNFDFNIAAINIEKLIARYTMVSLSQTKKLILQNDIQYQIDQITLHGSTSRNLLIANDNTRWQLNLNANAATGNYDGSGGGVFSTARQAETVGLTLQVPIDDQVAKQAVVNAKIALQQAELALKQEKWNKETLAINSWNTVISSRQALEYADAAEKLQKRTYDLNYQKYLHGLIDSLELQTAQWQLIQSQQTYLNAQASYLKGLVNLDFIIGHTLKTWQVRAKP